MKKFDVAVIGGGPAGLAAAVAADKKGASVLLIEREAKLGGILKQCIHDGFGLITFNQKLTGPEYSGRYIDLLGETAAEVKTQTFVTKLEKSDGGFLIEYVNAEGAERIYSKTIVLATGCRERTAKQTFIQGSRPAGVFTAGTAQLFVNLLGMMPTKKCVILGSGDIGLIMARRLTLEGAEVEGVYEIKSTPSGLTRNIHQCLNDYNIPLHLSHTVTKVFGKQRVEGVEIARVDGNMQPIAGTQYRVDCDALILSVGLIPENELAESLGIRMDGKSKGPICNQSFMTDADGVFSAGNALHVNDLVDYVSECAASAGENAAEYIFAPREEIEIKTGNDFLYAVPRLLDLNKNLSNVTVYFRSASDLNGATLRVEADGKEVLKKKYAFLRPPEMEKLEIDFSGAGLNSHSTVVLKLEA